MQLSLEAKLWRHVVKGSDDACWMWGGHRSRFGYGRLAHHDAGGIKRILAAHRVSWQVARGPIPPGQCVLHKCDNPPCCNPEHLFLGTPADNNRDRHQKGRSAMGARAGSVVHMKAMRRGESHPSTRVSDADVAEIRRAYAAKEATQVELGRRFGLRDTHVSNIVRGLNRGAIGCASTVTPIAVPTLYGKGEGHSQAKLTWDAVREIRERVARGERVGAVAVAFGVSSASVSNIVRNKSWKEAANG